MIQGKRIVPLTVSCKQKTPIRQSMEGRMTKLTEIVNKLSLEVDHVDDHILDDQMMEGLKDDNEMRRIVEEGEGDNGEDGRMVLKDSVKQIMEIKEDCRVGVDKKKRIKMMCDEGGVREIKKKSKIVENKAVDEHKTVSKNYCVDKSKRKT